MLDACGLLREYRDTQKMPTSLIICWRKCTYHTEAEKGNTWLPQWVSTVSSQLDTNDQLKVEAQVRKLVKLRLEKDMQVSTTLLALGLADKMEEQNNKLKTLVCSFAKHRGYKLRYIKI